MKEVFNIPILSRQRANFHRNYKLLINLLLLTSNEMFINSNMINEYA